MMYASANNSFNFFVHLSRNRPLGTMQILAYLSIHIQQMTETSFFDYCEFQMKEIKWHTKHSLNV